MDNIVIFWRNLENELWLFSWVPSYHRVGRTIASFFEILDLPLLVKHTIVGLIICRMFSSALQ